MAFEGSSALIRQRAVGGRLCRTSAGKIGDDTATCHLRPFSRQLLHCGQLL